jgi:hypothetical protein
MLTFFQGVQALHRDCVDGTWRFREHGRCLYCRSETPSEKSGQLVPRQKSQLTYLLELNVKMVVKGCPTMAVQCGGDSVDDPDPVQWGEVAAVQVGIDEVRWPEGVSR